MIWEMGCFEHVLALKGLSAHCIRHLSSFLLPHYATSLPFGKIDFRAEAIVSLDKQGKNR